jgi:hydrogenase nickel incorporation protein HypA/HybF
MHELGITQSILDLVLREAERVGASRITKVSLKAGEWSSIEPDCVAFYFDILSKGTPAEGAQVAIERVAVTYACETCGLEYTPPAGTFACPKCASLKGKLITGRELCVDSIEVDHADTGESANPGGE